MANQPELPSAKILFQQTPEGPSSLGLPPHIARLCPIFTLTEFCRFAVWFFTLLLPLSNFAHASDSEWKPIASRASVYQKSIGPKILNFMNIKISAVKADVRASEIRILVPDSTQERLQSVKDLCSFFQFHICINANFFDELNRPLGLVISGGQLKNPVHNSGSVLTGIFYTRSNFFNIVHRLDIESSQIVEAFQAGPRLISTGTKVEGLGRSNRETRRSGICIDKDGQLIVWIVHGGFGGIKLSSLQDILVGEPFGCQEALNLDGGGSTQLYVAPNLPGAEKSFAGLTYAGEGPIPVALGIRFEPA